MRVAKLLFLISLAAGFGCLAATQGQKPPGDKEKVY
jgi:hypothetical protein